VPIEHTHALNHLKAARAGQQHAKKERERVHFRESDSPSADAAVTSWQAIRLGEGEPERLSAWSFHAAPAKHGTEARFSVLTVNCLGSQSQPRGRRWACLEGSHVGPFERIAYFRLLFTNFAKNKIQGCADVIFSKYRV